MNDEASFLQAMLEHPDDASLRLVFTDWLEERGDPRGELLRLLHTLTQTVEVPDRSRLEDRLRGLLASGVQPVGPFFTNSLGMKFAWIPPGTFLMGSPENEAEREDNELQHKVTLSKGFYLAIHPVTQALWRKVMGDNPGQFKADMLPVQSVSWVDCQAFVRKLCERDGYSYRLATEAEWKYSYRLPTEAEWEYGCRAGTTTPFYFGETISWEAQANYDAYQPTPVGKFPPNAWGLYDMHSNVCEWCADWFGDYSRVEVVDPQGPDGGDYRVQRGGSFFDPASHLRSAKRYRHVITYRSCVVGFRPARTFP